MISSVAEPAVHAVMCNLAAQQGKAKLPAARAVKFTKVACGKTLKGMAAVYTLPTVAPVLATAYVRLVVDGVEATAKLPSKLGSPLLKTVTASPVLVPCGLVKVSVATVVVRVSETTEFLLEFV